MKKLIKTSCFLLSFISLGLGLSQAMPTQASYNSSFNREADFAKHEKLDAVGSFERVISPFKSVFVTTTKTHHPRNVSFLFYNQRQTSHYTNSASHWINVRWLQNGKIYAYNDHTIYGSYLVSYHQISKGHSTKIWAGKTQVQVRFSKKGNLLFYYGKYRLGIHSNSRVYLNGRPISKQHNRHFKGNVPTKGSRTKRLIADAKRYLGVPYRYAGRDAFGGLDCASFIDQVYLDVEHRDIGGMTGVQQRLGHHLAISKAKKGDLLFWQHSGEPYTYHVAMAIGHGKLIEEHSQAVQISTITNRKPQFAIHMH